MPGWPETSFAAALGLALGGARRYQLEEVEAEYLFPEGRKTAGSRDIKSALGLYLRACFCLIAVVAVCWWISS